MSWYNTNDGWDEDYGRASTSANYKGIVINDEITGTYTAARIFYGVQLNDLIYDVNLYLEGRDVVDIVMSEPTGGGFIFWVYTKEERAALSDTEEEKEDAGFDPYKYARPWWSVREPGRGGW